MGRLAFSWRDFLHVDVQLGLVPWDITMVNRPIRWVIAPITIGDENDLPGCSQ